MLELPCCFQARVCHSFDIQDSWVVTKHPTACRYRRLSAFTSSLPEAFVKLKTFGTSKSDSTHQMARWVTDVFRCVTAWILRYSLRELVLVKRIPTNLIHDVFKFVRGVIKLAPASSCACMDLTHLLLIWTMYWPYICQNRNPYDQVNYDQVRRPSGSSKSI